MLFFYSTSLQRNNIKIGLFPKFDTSSHPIYVLRALTKGICCIWYTVCFYSINWKKSIYQLLVNSFWLSISFGLLVWNFEKKTDLDIIML